ncbi:predicted GPI-anchored protein 58 [Pyrus x bretschneideri]|uniref:predicted GPI-anchored protein 58 n=1 Tax=Pyrus x bretschneideri TaxID=225117 RepID=UPI00202EE0BB|nr:predicted GPI-anchored protein 58 [Pyrus x bretschneideri]
MGSRRSTRLNVILGGAAPPPQGSTMGTTAVATRGEVHGTTTTARAVPPKQAQVVPSKAHGTKAMTQAMSFQAKHEPNTLPNRALASHPRVPHAEQPTSVAQLTPIEQPAFVAQPAPAKQSALVAQPAPVVQPAPTEQPTPVAQPTIAAQSVPAPMAFQLA